MASALLSTRFGVKPRNLAPIRALFVDSRQSRRQGTGDRRQETGDGGRGTGSGSRQWRDGLHGSSCTATLRRRCFLRTSRRSSLPQGGSVQAPDRRQGTGDGTVGSVDGVARWWSSESKESSNPKESNHSNPSTLSILSTKCRRQGVGAKHTLKPTLNPSLNRHTYSTRLIFSFRQSVGTKCGDKVWRQGAETRCGDKVWVWEMFCHWAAEGQRSAFTL